LTLTKTDLTKSIEANYNHWTNSTSSSLRC